MTREFEINVHGACTPELIHSWLAEINGTATTSVALNLKASSATDYMLVQLLALLRKEGKAVNLRWVDHGPSSTILNVIEQLTK